MSCYDLSKAFLPFANHKQAFTFEGITLTASQVKRINAIMQTCGFYDEAGEFFLSGRPSGEKWCGRRYSRSLPTTIFSCSVEPEIESKRKFRYGNQGTRTIDNTNTGVYFLEKLTISLY